MAQANSFWTENTPDIMANLWSPTIENVNLVQQDLSWFNIQTSPPPHNALRPLYQINRGANDDEAGEDDIDEDVDEDLKSINFDPNQDGDDMILDVPDNVGTYRTRKVRVYPSPEVQQLWVLNTQYARVAYNTVLNWYKRLSLVSFEVGNFLNINDYDHEEREIAQELQNSNFIRTTALENTRGVLSRGAFFRRLVRIIINIYLAKEKRQQAPTFDAIENGMRQALSTVRNHRLNIRALKFRTKKFKLLHFVVRSSYYRNNWANVCRIRGMRNFTLPLRAGRIRVYYDQHIKHWYMAWSERLDNEQLIQNPINWAAIDPGVRTPHSLYSPTVGVAKIGSSAIQRLWRRGRIIDTLISMRDNLRNVGSKRKLKRAACIDSAIRKERKVLRNLTDEHHNSTIHYLLNTYDGIIIPPFNVQSMIAHSSLRGFRVIRNRTVRQMLLWSHYKFRLKLTQRAQLLGKIVVVQEERRTSVTCSSCGNARVVGGAEVYRCRECGSVFDRDLNSGKNIFAKAVESRKIQFVGFLN